MDRSRISPTWDLIRELRNPLTEGELRLAQFLDEYLPAQWEVYVQPYFNGDRPDIVILNPSIGMMFFEVKDWDLEHYQYEDGGYSVTDSRGTWPITDPRRQAERYRANLIDFYVPQIGDAVDETHKKLAAFRVALYFHNATTEQAKEFAPTSRKGIVVFGRDGLQEASLERIVPDVNRDFSLIMRKDWADEIRFWLKPPVHSIEQGKRIELTAAQQRHTSPSPGKHQRLRGVAGSGKTLVLAQRAANLASQGKRVLIVTFNITLWHYVKDHVSRARVGFGWQQIEFNHFHGFCKNFLSENGVQWPTEEDSTQELFDAVVPNKVMEVIRAGRNAKGREYDAILIDEGQDFEKSYYDTLCSFLTEKDEVLFVADEQQNVYLRDLSWIDSMKGTKFRGRWRELKESYRLPNPIREQANKFRELFPAEVRSPGLLLPANGYQLSFLDPHLAWRNIDPFDFEQAQSKIWAAVNWLTKKRGIHPQDIVVLVPTHSEGWRLVRFFEQRKFRINHVFEQEDRRHRHKKSFWMGDSRLKMSTIHSFKGWELLNVIILTPRDGYGLQEQTDFLLYIAITRARQNLIVFNRHSRYRQYGKGWPEWEPKDKMSG